MRFSLLALTTLLCLTPPASAEPPSRRPPAPEVAPVPGRRGATESDRPRRRPTVPSARPSASEVAARSTVQHLSTRNDPICKVRGKRLVNRLLAMRNRSQMMSLEVWGDKRIYHPFDEVFFFLRAPRPVHVSLFWIGPDDEVAIPLSNLRIPGHRDVKIDSGGIVVPPLGDEQWVAIATLEPLPLPCGAGEQAMLSALDRSAKIPRGVGRWTVRSRPR